MQGKILAVAISATSYGYDKLYSYKAPEGVSEKAVAGSRVLVPFGYGNRKRVGIILSVEYGDVSKLKPVSSVIDEKPVLNAEMIEMVIWLKEYTLCTYFDALKSIIPLGLGVSFSQKYILSCEGEQEGLSEEERNIYEALKNSSNQREFDALLDYSAVPSKKAVVMSLLQKGIIAEYDTFTRRKKDDTVRMLKLSDDYASGNVSVNLTAKQKKVVEVIEENGAASVKEICYLCNVTAVVCRNLCKNNVLTEYEYEEIVAPDIENDINPEDIILSDAQKKVFDGICSLIDAQKPAGALLHGVTGSGKTSVFIKLIDYTLGLGKNAVLLIPQISLTPQVVGQFTRVFGNVVAVIHSNMSIGQRLNEYKRISSGQARIVVGTRSAVFAPLDNIGLIIMDEEDERTYKSENSPRYHARDVAKKRCATHNCPLLMASATPSVESYFYAMNGRYTLFEMKERYTKSTLPEVSIVDMADEISNGNISSLSDRLCEEIDYNLSHGEQTILLLNRRGYNTYISCPQCREPVKCPECEIPLTYHKINDRLICHYCGHSVPFTETCPSCGYDRMKRSGVGTQRIEEEISKLFPDARVLRMDADTTYSRYAHEKNFKAFSQGEYDIMVGTQMIAKGLDFPDVTLVGVISLDNALYGGDFRSYERTFSLITQVVGRSGRGEKCGRAVLQTYSPSHYILNLAANQDYNGFYGEEIALRKALVYPPYCDICVVVFSSSVESDAESAAKIFLNLMKDALDETEADFPMRVLGPTKASFGRINGKTRYKIIIKTKNTAKFRKYMSDIYVSTSKYKNFSNVSMYVDINGEIGL